MLTARLTLSFLLGVLAVGNPCALPLYPGFLAYLANKSKHLGEKRYEVFLGVIVLFGVLSAMLLIGMLVAVLATTLSNILRVAVPLVNIMLLILGMTLLLNMNIGQMFPSVSAPIFTNPFSTAYFYGFLFGPIVLPCSAPLVLSVFLLSATLHDFAARFLLFIAFGLGIGFPLFLISLISQKAGGGWLIRQFTFHYQSINKIAGFILIGLAVYNMLYSAQFIQIFSTKALKITIGWL
jgi:cytochrome c-type biogenesis protein